MVMQSYSSIRVKYVQYAKERISLPACNLRKFILIASSSRVTVPVNHWPGRKKMPARAGKLKTSNNGIKVLS